MGGAATRDHIVEAADDLFYRNGFEHTSFSDIAGAVRISRGNFYYHFKTKDEILDAVIARRFDNTRKMLVQWEADASDPAERIRSFIRILIMNRAKIMQYGCPVGTLCNELAKLDHAAKADANRIFSLFHEWLTRQFALLGLADDAERLAMRLLARSQGVATMATAFRDHQFVDEEVADMCASLDAARRAIPSTRK